MRASCSAASRVQPWATSVSTVSARWNCISRSMSRDSARGRNRLATRRASDMSGASQHEADAFGQPGPALLLGGEALPARGRQRVELRVAVLLGDPPFGLHESLLLHAVERGIERAFLD